jgi:hypothetical protein
VLTRILLFLTLLFSGLPVVAEVELHVVGIYEGIPAISRNEASREAQVRLDRPDAQVILVLSSYRSVDWDVRVSYDSDPPSIVLAQRGDEKPPSTVRVNGTLIPDPTRMELPMLYQPEGMAFRELVMLVPERFGVARLSSFSSAYAAPFDGFVIDQVVADDRYDQDYLRPKLSADPLPASLRALLPPPGRRVPPPVALTEAGFVLTDPDGKTRTIPMSPDMPGVSWPVAAVHDAAAGMIYGVTLGGDGAIYAYDEAKERWRVLRSMDGLDAGGMILDPEGRRLILTVGFTGPGRLVAHDLAGPDDAPLVTLADLANLPGLTDLYDPGNGPEATLVPVGIEGDRVLVTSTGDFLSMRLRETEEAAWRAYLIDLSSGQVDFVGYEGGIAGE